MPQPDCQIRSSARKAVMSIVAIMDPRRAVTPALADEIKTLRTADANGGVPLRIPRVTWHLGRWIRLTDWYPDYRLRLYFVFFVV
jgi:hypothetical protein